MQVDNSNAILGRVVRDKITGFVGTVTGFVQYLTGCNQALVVPTIKEDGTLIDSAWFDIQRLGYVEFAPPVTLDNSLTPGPDKAPPKR